MEIIYAKPINQRLDEAIEQARRDERRIEKILLTDEEWRELRRIYTIQSDTSYKVNALYHSGVRIEPGTHMTNSVRVGPGHWEIW